MLDNDTPEIVINVKGTGKQIDTYRVDMNWTTPEFTYVPEAKIWNAETFTWDPYDAPESSSGWFSGLEVADDAEPEADFAPVVKIELKNYSSKAVEVGFQAGSTNDSDSVSIESDTPYLDTGVTLSLESETAQLEAAKEGGDYGGEPTSANYSITIGGSPTREDDTSDDDYELRIPFTAVITPVLSDE